jgi:hypothetical protein
LFLVWKASGTDPYRLYNGLDEDYRPLGDPTAPRRPPLYPERVRAFLYACGERAREMEIEDAKMQATIIANAIGG